MPQRKYSHVVRRPKRQQAPLAGPGWQGRQLRHPATTERDYTEAEAQYLRALEHYRRANGRPFPTASEYLAVAVALGYRLVAEATSPPQFKGHKKS
jgi:type II secretory pathway pseudopilin PulG